MNFLSASDIEAVKRHDWEVHGSKGLSNQTRFYTYLIRPLFSPDLEVHIVAVKSARRKGICGNRPTFVKEVMRASVDEPYMLLTDIAFGQMAGYRVDWSKEGLNKVSWSYNGRWSSQVYSHTRGLWKIRCAVINPSVLTIHERFKYCAWTPQCGHILDYLKVYVNHPRVELLAKVGAGRFATRIGFVSQLESNKGLMRFFSANLEEIKAEGCGCDVIRIAYQNNITLAEARERIEVRATFRRYGLPRSVDAMRARDYIARTKGCNDWDYCHYLQGCVMLGYDLADTKTTFPKQFKKRRVLVNDCLAEQKRRQEAARRKEQSELAKRMDADIAATAKRFARLEKTRASFMVILPRKSDELVREGKRLHNCLGDGHYAAKMSRGETLIAFVRYARSPGRALVAVEYEPDQRKVLQCYAAHNQKPSPAVLTFVDRIFKKQHHKRRKAA